MDGSGPVLPKHGRRSTQALGGASATDARAATLPALELPATVGRYTLERELARGAMSIVYLAHDERDRKVALKVYQGRHANPARFAREVTLTSLLRHPHIVRLQDGGMAKDRFYLAMDLVEGGSLASYVNERGPQTPANAVKLLLPIVQALAYAHARGIVHRDIKPENILVDGKDQTYLTDFGLALDLQESTGAGQRAGTPAFMAPEQQLGSALDARVDIYGIGGTLYECLTGKTPFPSTSATELRSMILTRDPRPPSAHVSGIPPALDSMVLRCLAKRPRDRYASAQTLALALQRVLTPPRQQVAVPRVLAPRDPATWPTTVALRRLDRRPGA
jgi:serine/threonine protein kinase